MLSKFMLMLVAVFSLCLGAKKTENTSNDETAMCSAEKIDVIVTEDDEDTYEGIFLVNYVAEEEKEEM